MSNRDMSETTMELLGKLIPEDAGRDAIHIAVAPVVAAERLARGEHIGLMPDGRVSNGAQPWIGIVDPYLAGPVLEGQRFFLWLYPRTITSLRHEWTHPAFAPNTSASETWLREFADRWCMDYDHMIEGAVSGDGVSGGTENYDMDATEKATFWTHVEVVSGRRFSPEHRQETYFRCAC